MFFASAEKAPINQGFFASESRGKQKPKRTKSNAECLFLNLQSRIEQLNCHYALVVRLHYSTGYATLRCMTGKQIKRIRLKLGLTQVQLAEKVGVSRNTVVRWESGAMGVRESAARLLKTIERDEAKVEEEI